MELKTIRTVLGAKVTTFDRRDKVRHKKKESYKYTMIAKNQKDTEKQDLLNSLQARQWLNAEKDIKAIVKNKKELRRLKMKQAGKLWKLKNKY